MDQTEGSSSTGGGSVQSQQPSSTQTSTVTPTSNNNAPVQHTTEMAPNQTLYISNLSEKIKKEELRKALYSLFSQYGTVLDVIASKAYKLRGQAWVVFREISSATAAYRALTNFVFYDRPMKVAYAKSKSDIIKKAEGTWAPREKKPRTPRPPKPKKEKKEGGSNTHKENSGKQSASKKRKTESSGGGGPVTEGPAAMNNILFIQNLPELANELMLSMLFQQFPGYKEVRIATGKKKELDLWSLTHPWKLLLL